MLSEGLSSGSQAPQSPKTLGKFAKLVGIAGLVGSAITGCNKPEVCERNPDEKGYVPVETWHEAEAICVTEFKGDDPVINDAIVMECDPKVTTNPDGTISNTYQPLTCDQLIHQTTEAAFAAMSPCVVNKEAACD